MQSTRVHPFTVAYSPARKSGWKLARILYADRITHSTRFYYDFFPSTGMGMELILLWKFFSTLSRSELILILLGKKKKKFLSVGENFFRLSGLGRINTASKNFLPLLINFFPSQRARINLFLILLSLVRSTRSKEKIGSNYLDEFELEFFEDRGGNIYIYRIGRKIVNFGLSFVCSPRPAIHIFATCYFSTATIPSPVEHKIPPESLTLYNRCICITRDKATFTANVQ